MKSIHRTDFIEIGTVQKSHGTKGEIKLILTSQVKLKKWAFLEFRGKPVPFYIELSSGQAEDPIVKLEGVDHPDAAALLVGRKLLFPISQIRRSKADEVHDLIGYVLVDTEAGAIGTLLSIQEMPGQTMLVTRYHDKEILIPAVDAFITEINEETKEILLQLPKGILDL